MSERPRLRRSKRKAVAGEPPAAADVDDLAAPSVEVEPDDAPSDADVAPVADEVEPEAAEPPSEIDPHVLSLWGSDVDEGALSEEERASLASLGAASTKPVNLPWMGYRVGNLQQNPIAAAGLGAALLGALFLVPKMFFFAIGLGVVAIAGGALGNSAADKEKRSGLLTAAFSIAIGLAVIVVGVTGLLAEGDSTTGAGGGPSGSVNTIDPASYNIQQTTCSVTGGDARLDGLITSHVGKTESLTIRVSFVGSNGRTATGRSSVKASPGGVVVFRVEAPLPDASSVSCSVSGVT